MKVKLFFVLMSVVVVVMLITACGSYEKVKMGKYENDVKDSWIILKDDNTFSARINYTSTGGGDLAMRYHGTYSQKSDSKLDFVFSIKNDTEKRNEYWKIDKSNKLLIDENRDITFKFSEEAKNSSSNSN